MADTGFLSGPLRAPFPGPAAWVGVAAALFLVLAASAGTILGGDLGPGAAITVIAVGLAGAAAAVAHPLSALMMLLVASFFRVVFPASMLPAEPFVLAFGLLVLSLLAAVLRGGIVRPARITGIDVAMSLFLVWNIGSAIAPHAYPAADPATGNAISLHRFILIGVVLPFTMFAVGRVVLDTWFRVRVLLWATVGFGTFSLAVSILQTSGIEAIAWPSFPEEISWVHRAVGVMNQPVVNGSVLIICFVVSLYLVPFGGLRRPQQVVLALVAVGCLYGVYTTLTRAVWLMLVVVLIGGVLLARGFRTGFVLPLLALPLVVGVNWASFASADRYSGGVASTNEIDDRLNLVATALRAIEEKPWFGWGLGRFTQVNTYDHQQWSTEISWARGYGFASHQNELGLATELGLVGLMLWLLVLFSIARALLRSFRTAPVGDRRVHGLVVLATLAFVLSLGSGLTVDLRYFDFANAIVMLLVGAVVGESERAVPVGTGTAPSTNLDRTVRVAPR